MTTDVRATDVRRARRRLALPTGRTGVRVAAAVARFDRAAERALDRLRGRRVADRVLYTASEVGNHSLIWLLVGTGMALRPGQPAHAAVRSATLCGIESALVNGPIKSLFRRQRPVVTELRPHLLRQPRTSSFPSGHASAAFTFVLATHPDDPLRPALFTVGTAVAVSRAHVRIHHASDVIGGMVTGLVLGRLLRAWWPPGDPRPRWPRRTTHDVVPPLA